jgi:hypothetical protein
MAYNINSEVNVPLVRFHLERMDDRYAGEYAKERNPVLAVGAFVSMPYLVGADLDAHERYQADRLFSVLEISEDESLVRIQANTETMNLHQNRQTILRHGQEDIRVTVTEFTSRRTLNAREAHP